MALFPAIRTRCSTAQPRQMLRFFLTDTARRLAHSPLDSPVVQALPARATTGALVRDRRRLCARWRTESDSDGSVRLTATWRRDI